MSSVYERPKNLSTSEKRALLKQFLQEEAQKENIHPLSFAQQRLWVLNQLSLDDPRYNIPLVAHLRGTLNFVALQKSLEAIIQRHEILRTTFTVENGKAVQVIASVQKLIFNEVTLETYPPHEREEVAQRKIFEEARVLFDLSKGPLIRSTLFHLGNEEYVLLLTMHHIVSDGWSLDVIMQELVTFYSTFVNDLPASLPPLPIQYADFAVWQREQLQGEQLEQQLNYWKQQLSGELPLLSLPTDHPRSNKASQQGAIEPVRLSASLTQALKALSQQEEVTLFMTLLAAFQVLLARYSGQFDVLVGTPTAGRTHHELEGLIGFFVNTLVMRSNLEGDPSFREMLQRVKEVVLGAFEQQELPFEKLVEVLHPQRDLSRNPLFQVMFALQNAPQPLPELDGLQITYEERHNGAALFDLTLEMAERNGVLEGYIEYNTDLFEAATIARLGHHLSVLLEGLVADPEQPITRVPLLSEAEREQLLVTWNQTEQDFPRHLGVHHLFEAQVQRTPEVVALIFEGQPLSYQQLNEQANQLAHHLKQVGVQPQDLVGICLERSPEMVVALLGVLKAGAAYVPLDPAYPTERLAFMIQDSHLRLLLTQQSLQERFVAQPVELLYMDSDGKQIAAQRRTNLPVEASGEAVAYVIYTSGSTGKPKGTMITHRSLVNVYQAWERAYELRSAPAHHLQLASFSFDVFTGDVLRALCSGGRLVLCLQEVLLEPERLYQVMEQERIECMDVVPAILRGLLHYLQETDQRLDFMRLLVVGSDSWTVKEYQRVRDLCRPETRIINAYGVTESAIDSSYYEMKQEDRTLEGALPIGRPIANTQLYILDAHQQPVPIGVVGELYIGGEGLALGYLNRPELTRERFVPDPFSSRADARLYRTGDLVCYRADGNIVFLGRGDQQVKLRGYRIELGEIEAALHRHPGVSEAVVVVREQAGGNKQLVAYIVPTQQPAPSSVELRQWLKEGLPEYMLPSAFVVLEALPVTPNGKVNRAGLPAPEVASFPLENDYVAPRNEMEAQLAELWTQVLEVQPISIHANFFELGGHSLLAASLIARLRETFHVELSLRSLFETPNIAALAEKIDSELQIQKLQVQLIQPVSRDEHLPLSFAQQRLWFIHQWDTEDPSYNTYAVIRLAGVLDHASLAQSLTKIVERHETLRTIFIEENGQPVQVISPPSQVDLPITHLTHLSEDEREAQALRLVQREILHAFNLAIGPLLRAHLLQLSEQEHILILNMHHIVSDGWSLDVLMRELATLYHAFVNDLPASLPPLPIQYADFAVWQRERLQGEFLEQQLDYWKQQLGGELPLLSLPSDHPRPVKPSHQGAIEPVLLPASLTQALNTLSHQEGVTLFMTLLAGFQVLLARYSGQSDILVGTPTAGRTHHELEGLIGFFVNTLVMRSNLEGDPSFREVLQRVKEVVLGAFEQQEVPFEKLVEVLHPQRDLSRNPLFQVMFILQNGSQSLSELDGVHLTYEEMYNGTALFDLTLEMTERDGVLAGSLEYNPDLFEAATIVRLGQHLSMLLEGLVADPEQPITQVPLLSEAEREQLLVTWNQTEQDFPRHLGVHHLFEAQAQRTPEAIALVFEGQRLSYQQLNERANQLADYLKQVGVQPQDLLGICLERSPEMVIALLGVLKAGAAYVPLDPAYPAERLAFMIEDSHLRLLLTQQSLQERFVEQHIDLLCMDQGRDPVHGVRDLSNGAPMDRPRTHSINRGRRERGPYRGLGGEAIAYVLYTSGSTGKPKGVQIPHHALTNFLCSMQSTPGITAQDTLLAVTTLSFDIAGLELYLPLLVGARIGLVSRETAIDGDALAQTLEQMNATMLQATPATWRMLINAGWQGKADLCALCGGEALPHDLVEALLPRVRSLYNMYGPTETTIWSTLSHVTSVQSPITIGRPIANTQLYILDAHQQPVPIGVVGDLYIGGEGLALGYLNRPELTHERFVPDPFSSRADARLYRTGDLACYRADGSVMFLGRGDQQVKLRGYRIELGEIEATLHRHPAVSEAVVVLHEQAGGNKQLVAYLVPTQESAPSNAELRQWLKEGLPEYMIPSAFVVLEALPQTPNGKVNRGALPAPEAASFIEESDYVAPRNEMEAQLAEIWAQLLGVQPISIHANFFELGGHSLLATQVISRIQVAFRVKISLQDLFMAPTIAELSMQVENALRLEQHILLPPLLPVLEKTEIPPSFAQRPLWLYNQLEPQSIAYNLPYAFRLNGMLSVVTLEQSLQEVIYRHESLRTIFVTSEDRPMQVILPVQKISLQTIDLQILPAEARDATVAGLIIEENGKPFDLARGPLLRVTLVHLAPQEHILLLTLHHIIFDEWSMEVLLRDLYTIYTAFAQGKPSPLPSLPIQYSDFTLWQRQWLQGELLQREIAYWKQQLEGAPALLELATDHPRPSTQTYRGASIPLTLPTHLYKSLQVLSQQESATLFMTLLTAYNVLLALYSGQEDIIVGAAIAGRNQREVEDIIGCFINTLVLRTNLAGRPTFRTLVQRVREVCLGAYAHPDVPFDSLVEALRPKRNLSHNPLFQVSFALANESQQRIQLPDGITSQMMDIESETVQLDLQMWLVQTTEGIRGNIEYNVDLFDASTITRMGGNFLALLENVVAQPDQPLSDLVLLTEAERRQMLVEWNATSAPYAQDQCIHQLFEAQVQQTPDRVALVCGHEQLSYQQLNRRANQLARYLQQLHVGPEVLVGLCLERSVEMIVALLAILKAGGAYVPLDPSYPPERLRFLLQDTALTFLITSSKLVESLDVLTTLPFMPILIDICMEQVLTLQESNPTSSVSSEHLAYVIYTSGSTGQPKGAMLAHQGLCNLACAQQHTYGLPEHSRILQFASLNFDASIFEIVMAWGAGATLHLTSQDTLRSGTELTHLMQQEAITALTIPPSALAALLPEDHFPALQTLVCAGEACPGELTARWASGRHMFNAYGPTETTVWASVTRCEAKAEAPSIGHPITNAQMYVLDAYLRPVPIGVPGELYIGGVGLSRGYLNRPEWSAERFVPDPFVGAGLAPAHPGARLYKTGDVGRYLPTGAIMYMGRNDEQVKVRGYRIELGEINAALSLHPMVDKSTVIVREDQPGDKRLVAYVVPQPNATFAANELHAFLMTRLPSYMVPTIYISLEALPLSPSGKVDRHALPAPEHGPLTRDYVAPSMPTEKLLADIWSRVLKIERVGIHDNFFELGGDSILSILIINKANEAGLKLLPRQIFQHQTVAALAAIVPKSDVVPQIQAEQGPVSGNVPLLPIQRWFFEQQLPDPHHWNMPVLLEVRKKISPRLLEQAFTHLLQHHDALRLHFTQDAQGWQQSIAPADTVSLLCVDLSMLASEEHIAAIEAEAAKMQGSLNLTDGPLMRVVFFEAGPQHPGYLFILAHHLIVDIVSWQIVLADLQTVYQQLEQEEPVQLPKKTTSFKQWASMLQEYAQSAALQQELDYWLVNEHKQVISLPVDHQEVENSEASAETFTLMLDAQETQALLQELPGVYHSQVNEVLLTALVFAFKRLTGQLNLLVDLEGHGREEIAEGVNLLRTVGWFTTLAPIWLDLRETPEPWEALKATKEQIRHIPHNRIGYGALRYLSPQQETIERLKMLPQAEVSFNYMGRSLQELEGDTPWLLAEASYGADRSPRGKRRYLIEINSAVSEDRLHVYWTYSNAVYERATIEQLAQQYHQTLQSLIQHSRTDKSGGLTPSDFSRARISQKDLDKILAKVKPANGK